MKCVVSSRPKLKFRVNEADIFDFCSSAIRLFL